ncbi:MAG: HAD family hydrolase [Verrucomicrobia bacterium]|nr:HAD family hydrolase [Verrucomicrobiota bacterium]
MEHKNLKIRAVVFDVYGTLLEVGAPPCDADARWLKLFEEMLGTPPPLNRMEFSVQTSKLIARRHAEAKVRGIRWPEIVWPIVVLEALPNLARLSAEQLDEFLLRQMQIGRTLRFANHAAECLRQMTNHRKLLGIASNSQAYTLRELDTSLRGDGLNLSMFDPELRFWSFENGFSKPDPHVFRILTARLEARGIRPAETLMVGDRLDNDIEPARAEGWKTWRYTESNLSTTEVGGDWKALQVWMTETDNFA